eukprot:jgi/Chrpa1/12165/Chrysochromulina_OHIO_Genome00019565-RA
MARIPAIHMYIVRGMGVAERESTSTEVATLRRRALRERREQLDAHIGHALAQHTEVLCREHRRRCEEAHLTARAHGAVDGAHRHLRLTEAHVAAHEPIHRLRRANHVVRDLVKSALLVWCGLEREPRRKLRHARVVRRARRAAQLLPLGVHLD